MILGFAEMRDEDRPPEDTWFDDEAINEHFQYLKEKRRTGDSEPVGLQNELTKGLRHG